MKSSSKAKVGALALAGSALSASGATALTSTFVLSIEFFDAFTATEAQPASVGRLISGVATTYYMDFNGNLTAGPGGSGTGGSPQAGNYTIADAATGGIVDVVVGNPVADNGVSITAFDCQWNGGPVDAGATCSFDDVVNPTGGGNQLLLGFWLFVDGSQNPLDTANPTFDVTVTYD